MSVDAFCEYFYLFYGIELLTTIDNLLYMFPTAADLI